MELTYLTNSGFLLGDGSTALVFDDEGLCPNIVNHEALAAFDAAVFFVSHAHDDHFSSSIFAFADLPGVSYVLSDDVPTEGLPTGARVHRVRPGDHVRVQGYDVTAFGSTDLGVSFLLERNGVRLFHAGDLNNWHWKSESTDEEIQEAQDAFDAIVSALPTPIDLALFPVDPRMGEDYDLGARQFAARIRPRLFVPMHFREATFAATDFAAKPWDGVRVIALTARGETASLPL